MKARRDLSTTTALTLALAVLAGACYANTVANGFVFDDIQNIVQNRWITSLSHLPELFSSHAAGFDRLLATSYYRPMMHVLSLLTYRLFGLEAWAFHLVNVLFHAAATALAFRVGLELVRRLHGVTSPDRTVSIGIPAVAAALFAVHPIHTEAVAWIAGITDLSYSAFGLLAFLLYLRAEDGWRPGTVLGAVSFLAGALSKEPALVLPLLLAVYELGRRRRPRPAPGRQVVLRLAPFALAAALYLGLRLWALGGFAPSTRAHETDGATAALTAANLLVRYIAKLVWPFPMSALYVFEPVASLRSTAGIVGVLGVAALALAAWWAWRRPLFLVAAAFLILPLLPVLYVPALGEGAFAERYLYLPVFGFSLAAAAAIVPVCRPGGALRVAVVAGIAAGVVVLAVATAQRNPVWRDSVSLWSDTAEKSPGSAAAHEYLCWALYTAGRQSDALPACRRALELDPGRVAARMTMAHALAVAGRLDEATQQYRAVLGQRPDDAEALTGLGLVYMAQGWTEQAIQMYREAIRARPEYAEAHNDLGVALARTGRMGEAIPHLREAVRLEPHSAEYTANLTAAGVDTGRPPDAARGPAVSR